MDYPTYNPQSRPKTKLPSVLYRKPSLAVDIRSMPGVYSAAPLSRQDARMDPTVPVGGVNTATPADAAPVGVNDGDPSGAGMRDFTDAHPQSAYEVARDRLARLRSDPIENDTKGSVLYGATDAMNEAARSGSLAYTAGAAVGGSVSGLLNKKLLPGIKREGEKKQAEKDVKATQDEEQYQTEKKYKEAQTRNVDAMPTYRDNQQAAKDLGQRQRVLTSMFNKADEFDPADPANADMVEQMKAAKLPIYPKKANQQLQFVQDAKTGEWYLAAGDKKTGVATSKPVTDPAGSGQLATTSPQTMTAEQGEANRASREEIARLQIASRERIAAVNASIAKDRVRLSTTEMQSKYPGAGKDISHADLIANAAATKMSVADYTKLVIDKGFTIVGEYGK